MKKIPRSEEKTLTKEEANNKERKITLSVRFNTLLFEKIRNYINSLHLANDYGIKNLSDFFEKAFLLYDKKELELKSFVGSSSRRETSLKLPQQIKLIRSKLPDRYRQEITEKILYGYLVFLNN